MSLASKGGSSGWSVGGGAFRQRTYGGGSQVGSGGAFGGGQAAQHSPTTDSYAAIDMMEQAVGPSDNGHPNPHPHHGNTVLAPRHHDGLHPAAGGGGSLGTTGLSGELDDKLEKRKGGGGVGGAAALLTTARRIWPSALSLFLSVGTSMLVFPFFSYIKGTGPIGPTLPKVLFYIRLLSDIVARIVPPRLQTRSPGVLLLWSLIKTALVPVLLAAMLRPAAFFGDVGLVVLVSSFWVLSGYINTCAYLLAPAAVPPEAKPQAGGLMTVTFQLSCFVALLAAWVLHERVTRVPAADPPVILW